MPQRVRETIFRDPIRARSAALLPPASSAGDTTGAGLPHQTVVTGFPSSYGNADGRKPAVTFPSSRPFWFRANNALSMFFISCCGVSFYEEPTSQPAWKRSSNTENVSATRLSGSG